MVFLLKSRRTLALNLQIGHDVIVPDTLTIEYDLRISLFSPDIFGIKGAVTRLNVYRVRVKARIKRVILLIMSPLDAIA
jgi:hypothetical protein